MHGNSNIKLPCMSTAKSKISFLVSSVSNAVIKVSCMDVDMRTICRYALYRYADIQYMRTICRYTLYRYTVYAYHLQIYTIQIYIICSWTQYLLHPLFVSCTSCWLSRLWTFFFTLDTLFIMESFSSLAEFVFLISAV